MSVATKRGARRREGALALALGTAAAAVAAGCGAKLDYASSVHDLRVLAIQAEPPEAMLASADGSSAAATLPSIHLRALIVDAEGATRERSYSFTACSEAADVGCKSGTATWPLAAAGAGAASSLALGNDVAEVDFTPTAQLVELAASADPFHGFGGLPVVVELDAAAGSEEVVSGKRVVLTAPLAYAPDVRPNQNPPPPQVAVDGAAVSDDPSSPPVALASSDGAVFEVVAPDPSQLETYYVPTFDKGERQLKESWTYSWFSSRGHFSPERASGDDSSVGPRTARAKLAFASDEGSGPLRVWVVVRDGRGGEAWTQVRCVRPSP